jgi:hypothetical protein
LLDHAATVVREIPFTLEVGLAIVLSDGSSANLGADLGGVVPNAADGVDLAVSFTLVGILALLDAFASAEFAHGVSAAVKGGLEVVATLAALLGIVVPHALQVGFALAGVGVLVRAASEAGASGGDPFAVRIGDAGFLTSSVEFATLTAFEGLRVPSAADVIRILVETLSCTLAKDALAVAGAADPDVGLITRTIPFALVGVQTFVKTNAVVALLVANTTVPLAVRVGKASVLDEEVAALTARGFEELVVFADVAVSKAFSDGLFRASSAALLVVVIPQALRVQLTASFSAPAVLAFSLARAVGVGVIADFRVTVEDEVALSVAETRDLELQELSVGKVEGNPLRIFTAVGVGTSTGDHDGTLSGGVPDVFSNEGTVSRLSGENIGSVAALALVAHTNPSTEVREGTVDLVGDGSVD